MPNEASPPCLACLPVALEITPPAAPRAAVLLRRARGLGERSRRVNVIERPGRWSSLAASLCLAREGLEPVWHLANRGRSAAEIEAAIERARAGGLRRVLCIRGEYKASEREGEDTPKIREVVRTLGRRLPGALISVTANPFAATHPDARRRALANLDAKLDAGACGVQMQVSFDLESLRPFAEHLRSRDPQPAITPMLMPALSGRAALRVSRRLGIPLPAALLDRLERFGAEAGWEHFEALARAVAESPLYDGLAVMTPIDPPPEVLARLRGILAGGATVLSSRPPDPTPGAGTSAGA